MAGIQGARYCLLPGRLAGARPYVAGRHCGHLRHRLAVSADVLAGRLRGVHCALRPLYTSNSFVQQGSDWTTNVIGFARTVGVSSIRASTIRAMAIMTN